ncbi:hypothetical protein [Streptomyces sp. CBMA29]|uniref:hypothetical protein n=1 Tax=Streptomyces sp. CBMA29 TaxID=1896314 RepID=UPI00166214A8|nr:hypothetical protein [Streptomyces sp. CBMA29]
MAMTDEPGTTPAEDKTLYQRETLEDEVMDEVLAAYSDVVEEKKLPTPSEAAETDAD